MTSRVRRSEDGAVMILALLVITTVAVVSLALLTKGQGNFKATVALRSVTGTSYAADAAAQVAITNLELGAGTTNTTMQTKYFPSMTDPWVYNGYLDGTGCFGWNEASAPHTARNSFVLSNLYPKTGSQSAAASARVECSLVNGTGFFGTGPGTQIDSGSGRALTIVGTGSGDVLNPSASSDFSVRGGIQSAAPLTTNGLFTNSYVQARSCTGSSASKIKSTPAADCSYGGAITEPAGITNPLSSLPTTFRTANGAVQHDAGSDSCHFQQGYYDDAVALTAATTACTTSYFDPGTYYFDFHNDAGDTMANSSVMATSGSVWTINKTVVGGTPTSDTSIPGRCVSPLTSASASGVRFVFGGSSRISIPMNGSMELCGSYNGGAPPVVLYGRTTGSTATTVTQTALAPTAADQTGSTPAFNGSLTAAQLLDRVKVPNDGTNYATWAASTTTNSTVKLKTTGFAATQSVPAGSIVTSATLNVRHRTTATGNVSYGITVASPGATQTTGTIPKSTTFTTTPFDVTATVAKAVHDGTLATDPTVTLTQNGLKSVTLDVDAVTLDVSYIPPALRAEDTAAVSGNCVSTSGSGGCEFVGTKTSGNPKATFVVQGLTYVPRGSFYLNLANGSSCPDCIIALKYGLVARSLTSAGWPAYDFADPVISIPDAGPGFGANVTVVDLTVYVCPSNSGCTSGGTKALTARVRITDQVITDPFNPPTFTGKRKIDVMSWSEQR